jgi:AcrR family transcriptional regulator
MAGPGTAEAELPATVAAAWGVRERSQKGPKPALSLARIVDAGVRVADTEGIDAVIMGRVAASLDTAAMSLYRHVSSKDELIKLMVDAAWGDSPGPLLPGENWRDGLSRWAWAMRAALQRHPWAAHLPISGLPIMPREIAWFEDALACLAGTGLTEARKASVIMLLSGYVRNLAATEADIEAVVAASGRGVDEWMASYPRMLGQLTDPRRFPALTAFIAAGVFETADDPDDEFIFGLGRILDGVGVLIGELRMFEIAAFVEARDEPGLDRGQPARPLPVGQMRLQRRGRGPAPAFPARTGCRIPDPEDFATPCSSKPFAIIEIRAENSTSAMILRDNQARGHATGCRSGLRWGRSWSRG